MAAIDIVCSHIEAVRVDLDSARFGEMYSVLLIVNAVGLIVLAALIKLKQIGIHRLAAGWSMAGIATASLFVVGHDAAHGARFEAGPRCGCGPARAGCRRSSRWHRRRLLCRSRPSRRRRGAW